MSEYIPEDGPKAPFGFFQNSYKKNENHPDYVGDMTITDTLMKQIIALRNEGKMAVVGVAGWLKTTKQGQPYVSCQVQIDTYKTAKRYGVEESDIRATIDAVATGVKPQSAPAPAPAGSDPFLQSTPTQGSAPAPAAAPAPASDGDIFDDPLPTQSAPAQTPLTDPDDDLPF